MRDSSIPGSSGSAVGVMIERRVPFVFVFF